jgi:membrane protein DedA with SNARE-associated domain
MTVLQRLYTAPLLWIGVLVLLGYFAGAVLSAIYERCAR